MTRRLLLSYLGLAVLILLVLELPLATLASRFEHQLATNQIEKEADGIVAVTADKLDDAHTPELRSILASYESKTGGELSVIGTDRQVLAASSQAADDDLVEWRALETRALVGQAAAVFSEDEGAPYAVAAVPVQVEGRVVAAVILGAPANFTEHRIHQIWLALGLFAAGALVVAALAGLVLARSLTLPLGRLETTVDRFGRGDLASRASEREGPPEVRALAHQFNSMAVRLDTLIDSQKRFVADASHQLRSPLTALRLRIENLEATAGPEVGATAAAIGREVQRLSRIVDGLLTLGRAGEEGPQATDVKVHEVIAERCASWSDLAEEKGVQLVADGSAPAGLTARLRPGDLEQILDNLLANAVEVSPPGSTIRVDLRPPAHGRAEVHVVDEGPGLSEEGRSRAFDRFWQGTERPSGHSGLGLAIVAQLAARNDAAVELRAGAPSGLDAVVTVAARQVKER